MTTMVVEISTQEVDNEDFAKVLIYLTVIDGWVLPQLYFKPEEVTLPYKTFAFKSDGFSRNVGKCRY